MSEIPKYWRMIPQRIHLGGFQRVTENGGVEVSLTGISWYPLNGNGHHPEENPFKATVVYQADVQQKNITIPS